MEIVSIIVAVYKVEQYLRQCLDSIIMQTYNSLEIILVDDGSPDRCGDICEEYAKMDSRIHVIHKENAGLGMARNTGLEIAHGKYVIFIDSDDWVEPNMVEKLIVSAQKENCDFAACGFIREIPDRKSVFSPTNKQVKLVEKDRICKEILFPILGTEPSSIQDVEREMCVWTNLYKREIIEKYSIRFVSEREYLSEDLFFNIHYIMRCCRAVLLPDHLYHYRVNNVSLTNAFRPTRFALLCALYEAECNILKEYQVLSDVQNRIDRTMIMKTRNTIRILVNSKSVSVKERKKALKQILSNPILQMILNRYPITLYRISLRIPAMLMKNKNVELLWLEERLRYMLKRFI